LAFFLSRDKYPQTESDKVQFDYFTGEGEYTEEEKDWDISLVDDLRAMVQPVDNELFEKAHQTTFFGTDLPLEFSRKRVEVVVFAGIKLNWYIEGNVRKARYDGLLPIVIGDATGAAESEQEDETFRRINEYLAQVIYAEKFVEWTN